MLHKTEIIGSLGRDAEVKEVNGKPITTFQVAVDNGYYDINTQQWISRTIWYSCTAWRELKLDRLKKGAMIHVYGEPNVKAYINKDGQAAIDMGLKIESYKILLNPKAN